MPDTLNTAELVLNRLGPGGAAGLWLCSLPVPREGMPALTLAGRPTWSRALGRWPGLEAHMPRRRLLAAASTGDAPEQLTLLPHANASTSRPPAADMRLLERSNDPTFVWERHYLHLEHGGRRIGLALGLRTGEQIHWWEACRLITTHESPLCRTVEMGGAIPLVINGRQMIRDYPGLRHPLLHKHNWLYGRLIARLHSNGVCEVFAHHINSCFADEGGDLAPAVPVIGFVNVAAPDADLIRGPWDGSRTTFRVGDAAIDAADAARLATPQQPGQFLHDGRSLVWQPYQACELYGGACPRQRTGDAYILRTQQQTILRGMARTVRFSLSLSDAPPRVARYLPPAWWYGHCEELAPRRLLPVRSPLSESLHTGWNWLHDHAVQGGFEDGALGRYMPPGRSRAEPGWEGELPYAMFMDAWQTGRAQDYDLAMRASYHVTDVGVDHAAKLMRMHGYPPIAFSIPMNRVQGTLAAFLETGDDYLLDTAEAVVESAYRMHQNAWPRLAVGRDACFVRSALLLYRYFADDHYLRLAQRGIDSVVQSQRDDGSFGDQGGGSGIHQFSSYMTKPWMGLLAVNGVLDYLELVDEHDPAMLGCVRRLAQWLMANRVVHEGRRTWRYLHDYDGQGQFYTDDGEPIPCPMREPWHHETLARLLGFCALRDGDDSYLRAWHESRQVSSPMDGDHPIAAAMQFLPWLENALCRARWDADRRQARVDLHPLAALIGDSATIRTPQGDQSINLAEPARLEHV
jgi:hypothetical protein